MPPVVTVLANALPPAITVPVDAVMLPAKAAPVAIPAPVPIKAPAAAPISISFHTLPPLFAATTQQSLHLRRAYGRGDSKKRQVACLIR